MYLKVGSPRLIDAAWNYFNLDAIKVNRKGYRYFNAKFEGSDGSIMADIKTIVLVLVPDFQTLILECR